jgi:hypothetical protein
MNKSVRVDIDHYQQWFQNAVLSRQRNLAISGNIEDRLNALRQRMKAQIRDWRAELEALQALVAAQSPDAYQRLNRLRMDTHGRLLSWKLEAEILQSHAARLTGDDSAALKTKILSVCASIEAQIQHWETEIVRVKRDTERVETEAVRESYLAAMRVAADAAAASLDNLYRDWDAVAERW